MQCAYSEGFATYFGVTVRPDLLSYGFRDSVETDNYFPGCKSRVPPNYEECWGGTSYEGSLIEGAVAAFLYDLTDAAVESRDSIAAPGSYLREIIRTCLVQYAVFRRANGGDEIAYCTENAVNPSGYLDRFPTAYSEAATEGGGWSSARVHSMWTWNMYEKR